MPEYDVVLSGLVSVDATVQVTANSPEEAVEMAYNADGLEWSTSAAGVYIGEHDVFNLNGEAEEV